MANAVFNYGKLGVGNGSIHFATDTMQLRLVTSSYTLDVDHQTMTSVWAGVGSDQAYPATKSVEIDTTNDFAFWKTTANPTWTAVAAGSTIVAVVGYKYVSNDAGSTPVAYYDINDTATNGGDFTLQSASDANGGWLKVA